MRQLTRLELEKQKKLEMLEEVSPEILESFSKTIGANIAKSLYTQEEVQEFVDAEIGSFKPVMVTEPDLTRSLRLIRPIQVQWDETTIQKSISDREGIYMDTNRNRKLGLVGLPYDYDIIKGKRAEIGEIRHWGGIPYRKVTSTGNPNKDWQRVKDAPKKPGAKGGEKHEEAKEEKVDTSSLRSYSLGDILNDYRNWDWKISKIADDANDYNDGEVTLINIPNSYGGNGETKKESYMLLRDDYEKNKKSSKPEKKEEGDGLLSSSEIKVKYPEDKFYKVSQNTIPHIIHIYSKEGGWPNKGQFPSERNVATFEQQGSLGGKYKEIHPKVVKFEKKDKPTKTMSPKAIVSILKNKEDWGDMGDYVSVVDGKLQVIDSFYYGGAKRLEGLKKDWVGEDGSYAKYFKEEYGVKFKLVESDVQDFATGKYKKLLGKNMGIALIKLEVENIQ